MKEKLLLAITIILSSMFLVSTSSYSKSPIEHSWLQKSDGGCFIYKYYVDFFSIYYSLRCNSFDLVDDWEYTITKAQKGMYLVREYSKDGQVSDEFYVVFTNGGREMKRCPANDWSSCQTDKTVYTKVNF